MSLEKQPTIIPLIVIVMILTALIWSPFRLVNNETTPNSTMILSHLAEVNPGRMIVAFNEQKENAIVIIVQKNDGHGNIYGDFPINYAGPVAAGKIRYSDIVKIVGEKGGFAVIPKNNVKIALDSMLGVSANFQYK